MEQSFDAGQYVFEVSCSVKISRTRGSSRCRRLRM